MSELARKSWHEEERKDFSEYVLLLVLASLVAIAAFMAL